MGPPPGVDKAECGGCRGEKVEARGVALGSGEEGKEEDEGRGLRVGRKEGEEGVGDGEAKEGFRGVATLLLDEEEKEGGGNCSVTTSKM